MSEPVAFDSELPAYERTGYSYVTRGRTITEGDIVLHAGQTGDLYPIHLDAEEARKSVYGQRVAHGTLVFSIATGLKFDMSIHDRISYGYDKVRFVKPVFIGDTIRVRVTVTRSEPDARKPGTWRVVESMDVVNQHDVVVMHAEHLFIRWIELPGKAE